MEFLIPVFAAVALVWGIVYLRSAGLWGILLATLIGGTVFGHPFFHLGAVTLDRALLFLSIGIVVIYRFWGVTVSKKWVLMDGLMLFYLVAMIGTTLTHPLQTEDGAPLSKLIFYFLLPSLMYILGREVRITTVHLRWMFALLATFGVYLSLTALAEKQDWGWAVFPRYIADVKVREFLGRGRGPLLNPSGNGILITLGLSCGLMIPLWLRGFWRTLSYGLIPVYLLGLFCTLTRCVWMGGAAALVGITAALLPSRWRFSFLALVVGLGFVGLVAKSESFMSFKRDKNVSVEDMRQSAELRPLLAMIAWQMFQDRPLTGCGTGQYLLTAKDYLGNRNIDMPLEKARPYVQHNIFLAHLVENGLVGLIPFVSLLILWSSWAWRVWRTPSLPLEHRQLGLVFLGLMAGYIANGMFQDVLIIPMINSYLFFMAGCIRNVGTNVFVIRPTFGASRSIDTTTSYPHQASPAN